VVSLSKVHFVIPNWAESPVRNLLFPGQKADSSRDKTALRNDNIQITYNRIFPNARSVTL
jgi:hypothetical protein